VKNDSKGIVSWPEEERPRERLLSKGAQALTDAELVAILIRVGFKGTGVFTQAFTFQINPLYCLMRT
jgi:DNA repair protein RadC